MKDKVITWLLSYVGPTAVSALINKYLTKENLDKGIESLISIAEKLADKTETKIDDQIVARLKEILSPAADGEVNNTVEGA